MIYIYSVTVLVIHSEGRWNTVNELMDLRYRITAQTFEKAREDIEGVFCLQYPQSTGVNLQDYRLTGYRISMNTESDAEIAVELLHQLGTKALVDGSQVIVTVA